MKKKDYLRPTMNIVKLQQQTHLLAGSHTAEQTTLKNYNWNEYEEE